MLYFLIKFSIIALILKVMVIDFSISNFRSIREKKTFSLEAYSRKNDDILLENKVDFDLKGFKNSLLKGASIYGANASGKSNLLSALALLNQIALHSFQCQNPNSLFPIEQFALDDISKDEPSSYEINFIAFDGIRYSYKLELNSHRVLYESLVAYPNGLAQRWYVYEWDEEMQKYSFEKSSYFKADFNIFLRTRANSTYLSNAVANNVEMLKPVYDFLSSIEVVNAVKEMPPITLMKLSENNALLDKVKEFLKYADVGISDIVLKKRRLREDEEKIFANSIPSIAPNGTSLKTPTTEISVSFLHTGYSGKSYPIKTLRESEGTKRLFNYIAPFLEILQEGKTLFIDEIDTSLHPLLVIELLKLFFSDETNPKGAQIIFTTHNPIFLDADILRRDQVWFSAKNSVGETDIYSLLEYSPRKGESLLNGYLGGRYGAIPFFETIKDSMKLKK